LRQIFFQGLGENTCSLQSALKSSALGRVAERVKAPFLRRPCDHDRV